ncbi:hypothetical protein [Nonomuraea typhae]|uniref:hypothetical protein n=1 Tax=Nonomuraea typhae TaxID=2603600 RepID=UPI0012F84712|nr:hypothetical protein [Nonomuraea typhae]
MDGSRNGGFADSARAATMTRFYSRQVGAGRAGHRRRSVLEPYAASPNGHSPSDAQRMLPSGDVLPSVNGVSAETYDRRTWLGAS